MKFLNIDYILINKFIYKLAKLKFKAVGTLEKKINLA